MKTCVGIRTHHWTEEEQRLFEALHPVLGDDLVAVVHNPSDNLKTPVDVITMTDEWVAGQGLRVVEDYGWRCGDYAFYALRKGRPDYDFYWLVEPDIFFTSAPAPFFAAFEDVKTDLLGLDIKPFPKAHRWAEGMPDMPLFFAIFALTRMSARALDRFFGLRVASADAPVFRRRYPNDEVFIYSNAMADPGLTVGSLRDHAPDWFDGVVFDTDPDMIVDELIGPDVPPGRLYHPVRSRAACISGIAKRMTARTVFLQNMSGTLAHFDDDEVEAIVEQASAIMRKNLRKSRRQGWQKRREAVK